MKKILFALLIVIMLSSCDVVDPSKAESICIMKDNSAKETIIFNNVLHDNRIYPIESESKTGCLLLHDYYMTDQNGDGIKDKYHPFAEFGNDEINHCCIDGD
jgi:hypothetical protein